MGFIIKFDDCGLVLYEPTNERIEQQGSILTPVPQGFSVTDEKNRYAVRHNGVELTPCHYLSQSYKIRYTLQPAEKSSWKNQTWEPDQWVLVSTFEFCKNEKMLCGFVHPHTLEVYNDNLEVIGKAGEKRSHDNFPYSGSQYPHVNFGIK